jgi:MFS family permease
MLSYRALDLGASGREIGIIATSYALLPVVFAFTLGRRIDRDGPFRYVVTGNAVFLSGVALALTTASLPLLFVAAAAVGLGQLLTMLSQQAAAAFATPETRDRAFGRLTSAGAVGLTAGPLVAAFAAAWLTEIAGWSEATVGLGTGFVLCAAGLVPAFGLRGLRPAVDDAPSRNPRAVAMQIVRVGGMWQALLAGAMVLTAIDLLAAFLPLWASDRSIPIEAVGVLLALRGIFTLVSRMGAERMIRVLGRRTVLATSLVIAAGGLAVLPFVGVVGAGVIMVALGLGLGLAQPLTMSWVSIVTVPGTRAAALGIRQTANRIAQATLPATVAAVATGSGADGVFWGAAVLLLGASATLARAPMAPSAPDDSA